MYFSKNNKNELIFDNINDPDLSSGTIGLMSFKAKVAFDKISLFPFPESEIEEETKISSSLKKFYYIY